MLKQRLDHSRHVQRLSIRWCKAKLLAQAPIAGPETILHVVLGGVLTLGASVFKDDRQAWPYPAGLLLAFAVMFELYIAFSMCRSYLNGRRFIVPMFILALVVPSVGFVCGIIVGAIYYN